MKKVLFLTLFTISLNSMNGQDLNGKWLLKDITVENNKTYPGFHLLEITAEKAVLFIDFTLEKKLEVKLVENEFYLANNKKYADLIIVNQNHIKLIADGTSNDKKAEFILNFYRLLPTKTSLKVSEIEKLTYILKGNNEKKAEFKFNQELLDYKSVTNLNKGFNEEMRIEQIDSTLFISTFKHGKRSISFPIREVNEDYLKFYIIPIEQQQVKAFRKK